MIIFMNLFLVIGRLYSNFLRVVWNYTVTPFISFLFIFTSRWVSTFIGDIFCVWTIANYADAYWFLYSNKRVIYELRHSNK